MDIKAFKMDGLGNDFVIIDQRSQNYNLTKDQIIKICDRNFIGCDQLIFIKKSEEKDAGLEFYNSDGSISGACGNGTRCVADLLSKENNDKEIILWTTSGALKSQILGNNSVETEIGIAKTNWNEIPLNKNLDTKNLNIKIVNKNNIEHIGGTSVNVGNPHIVFFVKDCEKVDIEKIGPKIENHHFFPERVNVTFAEVADDCKNIKVNVNGDQEKIHQVLTNLIENSVKYGRESGTTEVSVENIVENKIIVRITDNGNGIQKVHLKRLFERFFRVESSGSRSTGGSGLGLAIVKHIIDAHNEKIYVESDYGVGSEFSFTLEKSN